MADIVKNLFGGPKVEQAAKNRDSDFADFAAVPEPEPESTPSTTAGGNGAAGAATTAVVAPTHQPPFTKWYRVHDRHSLSEFKAEGVIVALTALIFIFHVLGARKNRSRARSWLRANMPVLRSEFALVGFGGVPKVDDDADSADLLKEKSLFEFATYATGRQNTAFVDVNMTLAKRFNPVMNATETVASFFTDMFASPQDAVEVVVYPFDGKEDQTVPSGPGLAEVRAKDGKSSYEGFVWAIVHKDRMQKLREGRYDVTLATTKDNPKLPNWLTLMSENSEITNMLLTPELIAAVTAAGDDFDHLIVSDQPVDRPKTIDDAAPRKRLFLKYKMPSNDNYDKLTGLLAYFLRLPDVLVKEAHFRPEVLKKVRATREAMIAQIKKSHEEERNEERAAEKEKARKAKRDAELKGLDAKAQKKYLEKEKEKELRRSQKKMTMRG